MLNDDGSVESAAESREYRLARAYSERQWRSQERLNRLKMLTWLALITAPFGYAMATTALSNDLTADWFQGWAAATSPLSNAWSYASGGISRAAQSLYASQPEASEPGALLVFTHFATIDLGLILVAAAMALATAARLRVNPAAAGPQLELLRSAARGFPIKSAPFKPATMGGKFGGLLLALVVVVLVPLAIYFFYAEPLLGSGRFFIDAHSHCTEYNAAWWSRHRDCIQYADNNLAQTVWKLGWMSSLAVLLIAFGIWFTAVMALYPAWLLRSGKHA